MRQESDGAGIDASPPTEMGGPEFRALLEMIPAAAYTCDASGRIAFFNRRAVDMWGRMPKLNDPTDRFCGSFKLYAPDGTPIAHEDCWMGVALRTGESQIGREIIIERPDGKRITGVAHVNVLRNSEGQILGAINVVVDVSDRRVAEDEQARLAAIVESSTDAIVSKNLDGIITSWNTGAERLFGYTADEIVGTPITRLIPPDRHGEERMIVDRIRRGERVEHFETERITKDGRRVEVSLTISPVRNSSGRIIGASKIARDVTAQKQADRALRESEQRFRQFMENLPGLAWIKDLDGRYLFVNHAAQRVFGKYSSDVCGKRDEEIFPQAIAAQFRENDRRALASGVGGEAIETLEHEDGIHHSIVSKFPIPDAAGQPTMIGGMAIDITEQKEAQEALVAVKDELAQQLADLRRLHEMSVRLSTTRELPPILDETLRTAAAIEGTERAVLSLCDPEEDVLRIGASLGFDEASLTLLDRVPLGAGACGKCFRERRRIVVEDVETDPLFASYRDVARQIGFRAVHSTPLITRTGKVVGVLSTHARRPQRPTDRTIRLVDLCARQAADFIENARLYQELREADRRKDEFLAMLAHELRNPLAPLSNSLQLLRLSDDLTPAVQHVREIMERQVNHMVRLVDDLLEVARITQGKIKLRKELVDLATIIGSAVETSRPLIDARAHQLAVTISPEPLLVEADPIRLAQVVSNLLNNAAKYTPHGGQIWLSVRRDGQQALVAVRDNGQGIPANMLPRVFEMFAQVDHSRGDQQSGLGIGLALAQRLIQMHGGAIHAASGGIGTGSEFTISLPLVAAASSSRHPLGNERATTGSKPQRNCRRVLVVDDTESSAYVLGMLLEALGQQVRTAQSAAEALELARATCPQVVISDIAMPGVSGYELARRLRADPHLRGAVLVALTGYGHERDRVRAEEAGFDHYLVKPVSIESLAGLLESLPPVDEPESLSLNRTT